MSPDMDERSGETSETPRKSVFGRDSRLRNVRQLSDMRRLGIKSAGRHCVLVVLQPPPDGMSRAAFLISRRYSLLAVERNRARRLFREAYRQLFDELPKAWMLFIPRQRMKGIKLTELLPEIRQLAKQSSVSEAAKGAEA